MSDAGATECYNAPASSWTLVEHRGQGYGVCVGKHYTIKEIREILDRGWQDARPSAYQTEAWAACKKLMDAIEWHFNAAGREKVASKPDVPRPPKSATDPQEILKPRPAPKKRGRRA